MRQVYHGPAPPAPAQGGGRRSLRAVTQARRLPERVPRLRGGDLRELGGLDAVEENWVPKTTDETLASIRAQLDEPP